ncbi:hypothetical protein JCM24511_07104 [Saitozyma sp. JCM 24511]|nr:hypothetical protein JCM24511_07104 [Saitozyma sp. JCM 24511]
MLAVALLLPLLPALSLAAAGPSSQEMYDLAARRIGHGAPVSSNLHAKAVNMARAEGHAPNGWRKVRRERKRACSPDAVAASSSSSSAGSLATQVALANTSTTPSSSSASSGSLLSWLFPVSSTASWTTSTDSSSALSFIGALKPLTAGSLPSTSTAPDGSSALIANFPAGTYGLNSANGQGFSFYTEGTHNGVNVEGATEVLFSYSAYFPSGFDFVKGGKMPGLYGGTSLSEAKSCSGGRQTGRDQCFSARLMWRTNGAGEFYNYYPTSVTQGGGYCSTAPYSICDTVYGDSIGRGSYSWATGKWTTVAQRLKLNDVGSANGEQTLWVDGVQIMDLNGLEIITQSSKIYGIMAQTFFGGSDSSWDSPTDQSVWFKDWSLAVIA